MRKHYEATSRMFEVGQATRLAVLQAQIAVVQAEQKLRQATNGWRTALRGLQILLNVQGPLQLQHPQLPPAPAGDEKTLLAEALERRGDYRAINISVDVAQQDKKTAAWKWAPILKGNAQYMATNAENFAGNKTSWLVGGSITVPLWDGGTRVVDREEAESKIRQAVEQRNALESQVANEINMKLKAVEEAEADLVTMRHTVALAREGVSAAKASYEVGMATNLDVLDANQKQFEAEIGLIQVQIQLDLARLQLAHAVGTYEPLPAAGT